MIIVEIRFYGKKKIKAKQIRINWDNATEAGIVSARFECQRTSVQTPAEAIFASVTLRNDSL